MRLQVARQLWSLAVRPKSETLLVTSIQPIWKPLQAVRGDYDIGFYINISATMYLVTSLQGWPKAVAAPIDVATRTPPCSRNGTRTKETLDGHYAGASMAPVVAVGGSEYPAEVGHRMQKAAR